MIAGPRGAAAGARRLVAECLLAAGEAQPGLAALAAGPVDWARVAALARVAMAEETVAHALLGAGAPLDAPACAPLRDAYENASAKNALLLEDAGAIQAALRRAGVESVALKGAALVAAHYPAVGARHVGDLDLLVDPAALDAARAVLAALGMRQPVPDAGPLPRGKHHGAPWVTPGGLSCEVHVDLPGASGASEGVRARAVAVAWRGRTLRVPCAADLAGVAAVHALSHHVADPRFRARLVSDLAVLSAGGVDRAAARRAHGPEVDAAFALLDAVRAGDARAALPPLLGTWPGEVRIRAAGVAVTVGRAARHRRLLRLLFPDRAALARRYGVAESAPLLPLLWAWRPLGAVVKILTGR